MKILLTNDDGIDSPALLSTIQQLEIIGEVHTVVPRHEQSWTSKSNTRRAQSIVYETFEVEKRTIHTLDAQPADCANYGIYNLGFVPDLVVSGANIGHNVGLSAFFSSGTIGAALEGFFAGIPSVAISVPYPSGADLDTEPFAKAIEGIWDFCDRFSRYRPEDVLLANLNLPYNTVVKEIHATSLADYHYGSLFRQEKDFVRPAGYLELMYPDEASMPQGSDVWARTQNHGSVVFLNKRGNFVNPAVVSNWLGLQDLDTMGDEDEE